MVFPESTNFHDAIAPGQEIGKAERQLDAAIATVVGGGVNSSGLSVIYIGTNTGLVQNTTDEETILGTEGVGSLTLPADFFAEGVTLRFTARGYYSSLDGGDNVNLRIYLGATEIVDSDNFTPAMGANKYWEISGLITCREAGETGTVMPSAHISLFDGAGVGIIRTTNATIDTTGSLEFDLTAEWDTADLDNAIFCTNIVLEKMQVGNASLSPADVTVGFVVSSSTGDDCAETHEVTVELQMPPGTQTASAVTLDWSATNVDGTSSGTVTFPAGSSDGDTQIIEITLDYDAGNPVLTLSDVSSNATLGVDTHTVTLGVECDWCENIDVTDTLPAAVVLTQGSQGGSGISGVYNDDGLPGTDAYRIVLDIDISAADMITSITTVYNRTNPTGAGSLDARQQYLIDASTVEIDNPVSNGSAINFVYTAAETGAALRITLIAQRFSPESHNGSLLMTSLRICGIGTNPFA